jgi:hypothetical protein
MRYWAARRSSQLFPFVVPADQRNQKEDPAKTREPLAVVPLQRWHGSSVPKVITLHSSISPPRVETTNQHEPQPNANHANNNQSLSKTQASAQASTRVQPEARASQTADRNGPPIVSQSKPGAHHAKSERSWRTTSLRNRTCPCRRR